VRTYEALGERDRSLGILKEAPRELLGDIERQPELAGLARDLRFTQLKANFSSTKG